MPEGVSGNFTVAKTVPKIDFGVFPGQWEGARLWSNWGDSLFAKDGKFYASIGDHDGPEGTAYVYVIDPVSAKIEQVVDYNEHVSVPKGAYTPGKIHGALVQPKDGDIYFFGYRGSVRKTGPETKYKGDWLLKYSPETGKVKNLGIPVPYCSTPVLVHSPRQQWSVWVVGLRKKQCPNHNTISLFITTSTAASKVFSHPLTGKAGPRAMIVRQRWSSPRFGEKDDAGKGFLLRYNPKSKKVNHSSDIPGNGVLRAASKPNDAGICFCLSHDGVAFSFDTQTEKIKVMREGWVAQPLYTASCRLDSTGTYMYYLPGAHGKSSRSGSPVIQLNVKTGKTQSHRFFTRSAEATEKLQPGRYLRHCFK